MTEPNSPREAVEQHRRESIYPPLPAAELVDARGVENLTRVVVAQHGVYGRSTDGHWFQLVPLSDLHRTEFARLQADAIAEINSTYGAPQAVQMGEPSAVKFKVGNVVVLRSGGPRMTVFCVRQSRQDITIDTTWFVGEVLSRDAFGEAELEHAPPKDTP